MASESLFSPNWFRVANLHPQLGGHVQVRRQSSRDTLWYVFTDTATGGQHRLSDATVARAAATTSPAAVTAGIP